MDKTNQIAGKFLGKKVMLTTFVKVKEDWRNSGSLLKQYGYQE